MKILYEDTMPHANTYFNKVGVASSYSWQQLQPDDLVDIDILAVRSTTKVNSHLLQKAKRLSYVTTATAGTNHMDKQWLSNQGITWGSSAGCNSVAVAEYVLSVLLNAEAKSLLELSTSTIGIVGAGHVGTALTRLLDAFNIHYLLCDPPLANAGDSRAFVSLEEIATCDVVSLHVPFVDSGDHPTGAMINEKFLNQLTQKQLLINACRGEVIDEAALLNRLQDSDAPTVVLDVFLNEPHIDTRLLDKCWFVTPHIAGHSIEGKVRGTQMVYEQICERLGLDSEFSLDDFMPSTMPLTLTLSNPENPGLNTRQVRQLIFSIYDIKDDDRHFRQGMAQSRDFASLRKNYRVRRECSAYQVNVPTATHDKSIAQLQMLGFKVVRGLPA